EDVSDRADAQGRDHLVEGCAETSRCRTELTLREGHARPARTPPAGNEPRWPGGGPQQCEPALERLLPACVRRGLVLASAVALCGQHKARAFVDERPDDMHRAHTVDQRVMPAHQHGRAAVGRPFEQMHLPEWEPRVELAAVEPCDECLELA